jgi:hypothetical protein
MIPIGIGALVGFGIWLAIGGTSRDVVWAAALHGGGAGGVLGAVAWLIIRRRTQSVTARR